MRSIRQSLSAQIASRLSALIWRNRATVQADAARGDGRPDIADWFEWAGYQHPYNAWEAEQMADGHQMVRIRSELVSRIEAAGFRVRTFQKREGSWHWHWHAVAVTWSVDDPRRGIRWEVSHKSEQRALEVLAQELGV